MSAPDPRNGSFSSKSQRKSRWGQVHQPLEVRFVRGGDLGRVRAVAFALHPQDGGGSERVVLAVGVDIAIGEGVLQRGEEVIVLIDPPADAFPFTLLGATYLAQGDEDRALPLFEAALERDKADWAARVYRAEVHLSQGRLKLAQTQLASVVTKGPAKSPFVKRAKRLLALAKTRARS